MSSNETNERLASITRPNPVESDFTITNIEGEIPRELNGTLYRNGPNQKTSPAAGNRALHLFDGDGMIHAIRFDDGVASYRSRFARTESFVREQEEGTYCIGGGNLPADSVIENPPAGIQANTNVVPHAGRLFALVENAPPFEMDPGTLESKGLWNYDGKMLGMSTTAHPKIDAVTGQMWIHGYQPIEPYIQLYAVEPDGRVSLAEAIDAPWPSMMHDFAITENYVIFPLGSIYFDLATIAAGGRFGDAIKGRPDLNMQFGIRSREPGSETQWFEAPSSAYMFHPGNAYEEDGKIFMDACTYEDPEKLIESLASIRDAGPVGGFTAHPYLYEFDLAAGSCKETKLSEISAEFPRIDDRLVGYNNRWGYAATAIPGNDAGSVFRSITKYDREGGPSVVRSPVEGQWVGEPVFVPRHAKAEEDDGFVLNQLFDAVNDRSAIDILDARAIDAEPLARLWIDERMPLGFHGNWLQQAE
ncbi:MAG: carotenoid oxygenase family protein [Deltaproteobacteria bacterium]|nr:carotenoid oxygenase family protein [Deltaproteobacteria bacterium]